MASGARIPGKADTAAGMVLLKNEGFAVSDTFRRRWGGWHHIVHPYLRAPIETILGVAAVAPTAWDADCATSALFFAEPGEYAAVAKSLGASYLVFRPDGSTLVSAGLGGQTLHLKVSCPSYQVPPLLRPRRRASSDRDARTDPWWSRALSCRKNRVCRVRSHSYNHRTSIAS